MPDLEGIYASAANPAHGSACTGWRAFPTSHHEIWPVKDYRDVPIEVLREFALSQTHVTSIRQVADEVGVGRSTLHKFVLGRTQPVPRVRRTLALWYMEKLVTAHVVDVARPYAAALDVLVSELPGARRDRVAGRLLADIEAEYAEAGLGVPPWLEYLTRPPVIRSA